MMLVHLDWLQGLMALGSEVVFLEVLDTVGHLPLEVLKTHEPS
jgi:hypothetical protein